MTIEPASIGIGRTLGRAADACEREIPNLHDFVAPGSPPKLAEEAGKRDGPAIQTPVIRQNPYRQLVRRRFSEPLLLLLIFVFGVWMWDNYTGNPAGPQPDQWELAMRKADRDLRLAAGTANLPAWIRPALGISSLEETLATTEASFEQMVRTLHGHRHHQQGPEPDAALQDEGAYAFAVIIALRQNGNPAAGPFRQVGLPGPPPPEPILSRIIAGQEHWWDLEYLKALDIPETEMASRMVNARTEYLTTNAIKARGAVLALALGGLIFVPGTLLAFLRPETSARRKRVNYSHRWLLNFGLGVFLLAFLAHIGFSITFNAALQQAAPVSSDGVSRPLMSMPVFITLDGLTRFLPAFIALGLLFRRSRHAVSRLGIAGPIDIRMILGCFAILQVIEFGLRMTLDRSGTPDPLGGLQVAEDGMWGLLFGIVSACIAAPIAEEILYRGVLFRSLANRIHLAPAIIISSVVFAIVHFYPFSSLVLVGAVGAACALCYLRSGTLLTAIGLHALYNVAIKIPEWIVYHTPLS
ncbi:MAG: CPBP family intramembrane glutamic endopeptidase [Verrucomicrobiota bacterium]